MNCGGFFMAITHQQTPDQAATYTITITGAVDPSWSAWFADLACTSGLGPEGTPITTLRGPVIDQSALRGVLNRLWDLNLSVLAVERTAPPGGERSQINTTRSAGSSPDPSLEETDHANEK
jgi:hypothetical protein